VDKKYLWLVLPIMAALLLVPATADNVTVTAEVPTYVSVVFNYDTVNFGTVSLGSIDYPAPGQGEGIYNVSVTANVPLTVSAYRSAWTYGAPLILKFATGLTVPTSPQIELISDPRTVETITEYGYWTHYHGYWLTVSPHTPAGYYSTTVTITYTPAA
jgi:hypothetical protein